MAASTELQISLDNTFSDIVKSISVNQTTSQLVSLSELPKEQLLYLRGRHITDTAAATPWSNAVNFSIQGINRWLMNSSPLNIRIDSGCMGDDNSIYFAGLLTEGSYTYTVAIKLDRGGTCIWAKKLDGWATESSSRRIAYNPISQAVYVVHSDTTKAVRITRLSTTGTLVWSKYMDSWNGWIAYECCVDSIGDMYISTYRSTATTAYLSKFDSECNPLWTAKNTRTAYIRFYRAVVDSAGNICMVGLVYVSSAWYTAIWKYAPDGTVIWQKYISNYSATLGMSIAIDSGNNIIITGYRSGTYQGFVCKLTTDGVLVWAKLISTISSGTALGIYGCICGTDDTIYLVGGLITGEYGYLCKLDTAGLFLWQKSIYVDTSSIFRDCFSDNVAGFCTIGGQPTLFSADGEGYGALPDLPAISWTVRNQTLTDWTPTVSAMTTTLGMANTTLLEASTSLVDIPFNPGKSSY